MASLGELDFSKSQSNALQSVKRITELGNNFVNSFANFQSTFDKTRLDADRMQKKSFRDQEKELVAFFNDGPMTDEAIMGAFTKLESYLDDAGITTMEFTQRMNQSGDAVERFEKTYDTFTNELKDADDKQRKLKQAGVATDKKVIDGKVQLVAMTQTEIFAKQQLMHNLEKQIEEDEKELKNLAKKNDHTQEQLDRQVELIDKIESNNEEIGDIQNQGVKKLKGDLGLFGEMGRVLSDGYNDFRTGFDDKVNSFFPAPLAGIITGFVDSIQTVGAQLLDFAKPFIQTAKFLIGAPKKIGEFFSEGGGFQKGLQAFGKGIKTVVGGLKKFAVAILLPILGFVAIGIAIAAIVAAITYAVLKIKNFIDDLLGTGMVNEDDVGDSALRKKEDGSLETKEEAVERINTDIKENKKLQAEPEEKKIEREQEVIKEKIEGGETHLEKHLLDADEQATMGMQLDMMAGHSGYQSGGSEQFYRPNGPEGPGIYSINRSTGKQNLLKSLEEIINENRNQFQEYSEVVLDEETKGNYITRKAKKVATSDIKEQAFVDEFKRKKALEELRDSSLERDSYQPPANVNINKVDSQQNSNAAVIKGSTDSKNISDQHYQNNSSEMN